MPAASFEEASEQQVLETWSKGVKNLIFLSTNHHEAAPIFASFHHSSGLNQAADICILSLSDSAVAYAALLAGGFAGIISLGITSGGEAGSDVLGALAGVTAGLGSK